MCPNDGAIQDEMLHIRVIGQMLVHACPDIFVAPAGKAFVDTVPVAILRRQQPPLGAAAGDPENSFEKATALGFLAHVHAWTGTQKRKDFQPLIIA
jgi:hypothetical protein